MGSLEAGLSAKKESLSESSRSSSTSKIEKLHTRSRSTFPRHLLPKKFGYLQWICIIIVFSAFLVFFQSYLPVSVVERAGDSWEDGELVSADSNPFKDIIGDLDFGEDLRLEPKRLLSRFKKEARELNESYGSKTMVRLGHRKPRLALVFADLAYDSYQILMTTVAAALQEVGYSIEVFSAEDGPAVTVWRNMGVPVSFIQTKDNGSIGVDWLNYDGILVNSLEAKGIVSCLMQEPFKSVPLIWTIHEGTLAARVSHYMSSGKAEILSDWRNCLNHATMVVFPNYALPVTYSTFDVGNYFVIPGAPAEICDSVSLFNNQNENSPYSEMDIKFDDIVIAIAGSHFFYKGLWIEHSLILKALMSLLDKFPSQNNSDSRLKIFIITGDGTNNYTLAVEAISAGLKYPKGVVKHVAGGANADIVLRAATLVIYGSFREEQSFPDILAKALCFGKLIIAPNLSMIGKYVDDRVNGYLFPKGDIQKLVEIISQVVSEGKLTNTAHNVASLGRETAKNLMVADAVEGYAFLLESMLKLPSEVAPPKTFSEGSIKNKREWQWDIFKTIHGAAYKNRTLSSSIYLDKIEHQNQSQGRITPRGDEAFIYRMWEEEKETEMNSARKRREEDEVRDRSEQYQGSWDDVYRNAKRADRAKNDLRERDDGELERTGQLLCIYEPYFGEGASPFLQHTALYRGIGLSARGQRSEADDIDASSHLPLLSDPYYRDVLGELGAFFAIAYRVDRVHRNAWIGFQSWRLTARKAALSKTAENALLDAIQTSKNGDTLYFWARMDLDSRCPGRLDFWSFCDAINAGNCKSAFSNALKRMYGISHELDSLPPMPSEGDTWSVMHSWVLPTRSFLEFVMFARVFVDSMDAEMYDEHHDSGLCYLSLAEDKHCYSRVLELLVNVWAYHSSRRMVYINPKTGIMQEQHGLKARRGKMWVKWFSYSTLKSMDEDLAEEADTDPRERWLWPSTGEVFWPGMLEKERSMRQREKEKKKQQSKDKLQRMRKRTRQKTLGKFVKPAPLEVEGGNMAATVERM